MPRRVLIVSPSFPPVNTADHQRVRMSLPYLAEYGWEAHVLAVEPRFVEGCLDPDLLHTVPESTAITRVGAIPAGLTRAFGFGSLWLRAGRNLRRAGARLLAAERFDLVYFSTTVFSAMSLGPRWKKRFGIPFVLDFQDPWVSDYYARTGTPPPGGRLRYGLAQWSARRNEPEVVRQAAHIITVSPAYVRTLTGRYPDVPVERFTVLPFAAAESDFQVAEERDIRQAVFDLGDGYRHWVYLGRCGRDIMSLGLAGLFLALKNLRQSKTELTRLRLHFVGTSYAPQGRAEATVQQIADEYGVGDLVEERTQRIPYFQGLRLLQDADTILVVGSDDPGYSASKVYPCILARRPLLAVSHESSPAADVVRRCRAGDIVTFASGEDPAQLAGRLGPVIERLLSQAADSRPDTNWDAFAPYTAREMTRQQCAVFDTALAIADARVQCLRQPRASSTCP